MSCWIALTGSVGAAMFAWRSSPSVTVSTVLGRRRARWLAAACALFSAFVWIEALGWLPGLCAACVSIGASCSVMPFAAEVFRRVRVRTGGGRTCHIAS